MTSLNIDHVRTEIDEIDRKIVGLIAERQRWVQEAGKLKVDCDDVRAPARVEKVIAKVRTLAADAGASPEVVEQTYRSMIAAFIEFELTVHEQHGDHA